MFILLTGVPMKMFKNIQTKTDIDRQRIARNMSVKMHV